MNVETLSLAVRARVHAALGEPARLAIVDALAIGAGANHVALHVVTAARESPLPTWRELSFLAR